MMTEIKHYRNLELDEFHDLVQLRIAVFVIEQNCPYQDLDGIDKDSFHVMVKNEENKIIETARIIPPGITYEYPSVGRVVSHPDFRGLKLGHLLMKESLNFIDLTFGKIGVVLSAQEHLENFYKAHGFEATSMRYLEDGIPHVKMIKPIL